MNVISESLIKSVDIVVNDTISKIKFDITIVAEIKKIVNLNTGEYKVEYNGNLFSVYSQNPDIIYEIGQNVYVKIPEGDYSKKKFIEISADTDVKPDPGDNENGTSQDINLLEPDFILYDGEEIGLIAGVDPLIKNIEISSIFDSELFKNYNNFYNKIQISALFRTRFKNRPIKGDYGLKITFILADGKEQEYTFSLSSFSGDPYAFINNSFQKLQLNIELKTLVGIKQISFFQNNFEKDYEIVYDSNGQPEKEYNETEYNLFVKDIKINYFELVDYTKTKYYLSLLTPQGNSFINNDRTELTLKGILKYYGKEVDTEECEYFWYKENYSITPSNENYNILAGPGWELIPNETSKEYIIKKADYNYIDNRKFKLIVVYNEDTTISKEIQIFFKDDRFEIQRDGVSQLLIFDKVEQKQYNNNVVWYYSLPSGLYDIISTTTNEPIDISSYLIHDFITFYVEVYDEDNNIISYESKIIEKELDSTSVSVSFLGNTIYHYDANGQPTFVYPEKNKTLNFHINSESQFKATWLIDNVVIGSSEYLNPDNSMIYNLLVSADGLTLNYNVKNNFNGSFTNNTITLKLESVNGNSYLFYKDLLFIKDGDQGTNGTDYICTTFFWDAENNKKLEGFNSVAPGQTFYLKTDVYQNGNLIENASINYTYKELDQTCITKITQNNSICSFKIVDKLPENKYNFVIRITVKVDGITIYNNYPIPIKIGSIDDTKVENNIPSYIRYNSQGTNPQVINNDIIFMYDTIDCVDKIIALNENIIKIVNKKLKPAPYYNIIDNTPAILKIYIDDTQNNYILYPIVMYIDTFGNQSINDWDGTAIEINESNGAIFAPTIGAGEKDSQTNQFTGVLMGKYIYVDIEGLQKVENGLFGFKDGQTSFGFKSDGSAFIGLPGEGQIIFEGTKGIIQSGNYITSDGTEGMQIDLEKGTIDINSGKINIGNNFIVDSNGNVTIKSVSNDEDNIIHQIQIDQNKLTSKIEDAEGNISAINQYAKSITLSVSNGETSSNIQLKAGNTIIKSENITFTGFVTFTSLSSPGQTTINGSNITTGLISANRLDLSGAITFNDLSISVQDKIANAESDAADALQSANDATNVIDSWSYKYGGTTYIDGAQIYTDRLIATQIGAGEVSLLNSSEREVGTIKIASSSSAISGQGVQINAPAIGIIATSGDVYIESRGSATYLHVNTDNVTCKGGFCPNGSWNLGSSSQKWANVYATNGTIQTSDRQQKTEIKYGLGMYEALFDSLRPCSYKMADGGKRIHLGMISQDVEEAMIATGVSDMDFAGFIKTENEDGTFDYALRYSEFIPILIEQIQKLKQELKELKG